MYSIAQVPSWFKCAQTKAAYARLVRPVSYVRCDTANVVNLDPLKAVEKIWRSQRWQTAWLQLW